MTGDLAIGVDVGGSSIKAAAVQTLEGSLISKRLQVSLPNPSTPSAVVIAIISVVRRIESLVGVAGLPVGVDVPSVVVNGVTRTAANIDPGWVGFDLASNLCEVLGSPARVLNDADAAGLAEMHFGASAARRGTVVVVTLGTGFGSALFHDGHLVPNLEMGHMEIRGRSAETRSAAAARIRRELSWNAWATDLDEHLWAIFRLVTPELIVIGGGVSEQAGRFIPRLTVPCEVAPALLRNDAGLIGAAWSAGAAGAAGAV